MRVSSVFRKPLLGIALFMGITAGALLRVRLYSQNPDHLAPSEDLLMMPESRAAAIVSLSTKLRKSIPASYDVRVSYYVPSPDGYAFALARELVATKGDAFERKWKVKAYYLFAIRIGMNEAVKREIPGVLAENLEALWTAATLSIATSKDYSEPLDGKHYYFGCKTDAFFPVIGKTSSPEDASWLHTLVRIADNAVEATISVHPPDWEAILSSCEQLKKRLPSFK